MARVVFSIDAELLNIPCAKNTTMAVKIEVYESITGDAMELRVTDKCGFAVPDLNDINSKTVCAVAIVELESSRKYSFKKIKKTALALIYNQSSTTVPVYQDLVFTCGKDPKFNRQEISTKLGLKIYEVFGEQDGKLYELQLNSSSGLLAVVDCGGSITNLKSFVTQTSGRIFDLRSSRSYITEDGANRLTLNSGSASYNFTTKDQTSEMVVRELAQRSTSTIIEEPLPPIPSPSSSGSASPSIQQRPIPSPRSPITNGTLPPLHRGLSRRCGQPPASLDTPPFFYDQLKQPVPVKSLQRAVTRQPTRFIYDDEALLREAGIETNREQYRRTVNHKMNLLTKQPSKRLSRFMYSVCRDEHEYQALIRNDENPIDHYSQEAIYSVPKLTEAKNSEESIEKTLYKILQRIQENKTCFIDTPDSCPLELTSDERKKFCLRLEFIDVDLLSGGWKEFASEIIRLDNDDLTLIDEFAAKYALPPVEVILEHWYNLALFDNERCRLPASKDTIKQVLRQMGKENLLHEMGW